MVAWIRRKALIFDAHEWFEEVPELQGRSLIKWFWKTMARICLRRAEQCYTVSATIADILSSQFGKTFSIVRNMPDYIKIVSDANLKNIEKNDPLKLVYIGQLNAGRGLEEAIEATASLPWIELHIYGTGELEDKLRKLAKGYETRVIFHGYLAPKDFHLLRQYHLGLNLLQAQSKSYYFSLANKFFDYIQVGLPVICMEYPEYAKLSADFNCTYFMSNLNAKSLIDLLKNLRESPADYRSKVREANKAKEQWTWDHEKLKLLSIYKEL